MIPYARQEITADDIESVVRVLQSEWLTQGPAVPLFEHALSNYTGAKHAVAVNSATSALHLACLALDVRPGDLVWTSPNTFVASANCALYCNAAIDFVDIDGLTYNMSVDKLKEKLEEAHSKNRLPKVIVAVHFAGQPCDMAAIYDLKKKYGFKIVEDASHAVGAKYLGTRIGACAFSDVTIFSFHPVKIFTTAEGGAVLTNCDEIASKVKLLRSHGIARDVNLMTHKSPEPWYYEQLELGYNYRMSDLHAALGLSQINRLDSFLAYRQNIADEYSKLLKDLPIATPWISPDTSSSWHLYVIRLKLQKIQKSRLQVFQNLRDSGVGVQIHYIPIHLHPYFLKMGFKPGDFPVCEQYYAEALSLPIYTKLTRDNQLAVIRALEAALSK